MIQCVDAAGRIVVAGRIVREREISSGCITEPFGIANEGALANRRVIPADGITIQR